MSTQKPPPPGLSFPKRWLYLIALKIIILALIVYTALHLKGLA